MQIKKTTKALSGAEASAEAMRQINPDVCPVYPITPQTPIMMKFAEFVADGKVDTELIRVESEHSAMSASVGSSAAGARTMTATSSVGLALMMEIVYIASSLRLPIVMNLANRALSGPINIHCDHSDSMAARDSGWLQFYAENAQEAYDHTIMALKIAENKEVMLPVMCCQDGFITSHCVEKVDILDDNAVHKFIGEYLPEHGLLFNIEKPATVGGLDLFDYYFEHKKQQIEAMESSKEIIKKVFKDYEEISGKKYDFVEPYLIEDAERIIVA
ncbi:MAG: pyruvate ferredoxin oxidoreductase, partial [Candidatus Woesearchaeota archaeon]